MRLFQRTTEAAAQAILANGFTDSTGDHGTGVSLLDLPVYSSEEAETGALLVVDLAVTENEIADFEVLEARREDRTFREWLIPAAFINSKADVRRASEEDEAEGEAEWLARAERIRSKSPLEWPGPSCT